MGQWAQELLSTGGLPVLALLVLLENLFPPLPSEVILPFAGFLAARGEITFVGALIAATAGSLAGALALYGLARYGGRPLLYRHSRLIRIDPRALERADRWFDRHGSLIVLFGRLVPGVRSVVSLPAGASEMPLWRFVGLTAIGSSAWNALLIGTGSALGANWEEVSSLVERFASVVYLSVAAGIVLVVAFFARRRMASRARS